MMADNRLNGLFEMLRELEQQKFWGSVELKFECGRLVHVTQSQTFKAEDLNHRASRGTNEHDQSR